MKCILKFATYFLVAVFAIASCKKDRTLTAPRNPASTYPQITDPNKPPVAIAGADRFVQLPMDSIELSGSGVDPEGGTVTYSWDKISGPSSFIILNPNNAATHIRDLVPGVYVFELKVTDNGGLSGIDRVVVTADSSTVDPCNGCWDY